MEAVVTRPGAGKAWLAELPEPSIDAPDDVLVQTLRVGVCGTDRHVMEHAIGGDRSLPPGDDFLVIGHEAVGRVVSVGDGVTLLQPGDVVVPTVRRGCGECPACDSGSVDVCFTGRYRERGLVGPAQRTFRWARSTSRRRRPASARSTRLLRRRVQRNSRSACWALSATMACWTW